MYKKAKTSSQTYVAFLSPEDSILLQNFMDFPATDETIQNIGIVLSKYSPFDSSKDDNNVKANKEA